MTNTATVAPPAGVTDANNGNNTSSATITINAAAPYSFCATPNGSATSNATYSIVNGVNIARYEPGAGADANVPELALPTVAGDVNALMIDPAQDRLLFHAQTGSTLWAYDADNGGWYAAASVSGNFPRGGMASNGTGYLMAGGASPAVWRITPSGPFNYTVANIGNLTFDVAPQGSNTSGDIAFDANGDAWLLVGRDLYKANMATLQAVRQTRPLIGGAVPTFDFAGIAFADDGTLYLANNAGGGGSAYYAYNPATGALTQAASTGASASRDLASCAFPTPSEPDLSVVKTLAQVNGATYAGGPVAAGNTLAYVITITNAGTAVGTLYPEEVIESVPANTTYVAAGNDFTQASGANWTIANAVNVPAGGSAVLHFVVQANDPLPTNVTSVANNVTFPPGDLIDCTDTVKNTCSVTTPIGPNIVTTKTSDPASGSNVTPGQTITYTLNVAVSNAATTAPLTLTDTLGAGLTFGAVTSAGAFNCTGTLSCTLPAGTAPGIYAVSYSATVDTGTAAGTTVNNSVATDPGNNGGDETPSCPAGAPCTTEHEVTGTPGLSLVKSVSSTGPYAVGSTIAYDFLVTNTGTLALENVSVTDPLPGLSAITCPATMLAVGANMTCTASYVVTQADVNNGGVHNSATAQGVPPTPPGGPTPPTVTTPPSEVDVPLTRNPGLSMAKSVTSTGPYVLGSTIAYSFLLTNTGNVDLSGVSVTDPLPGLSAISCPATTLAVGANMTCTATYVVTAADVGAGNVHNSAIGTGIPPTPPGGPTPPPVTTPPSEVDVPVQNPGLTLAKSVTSTGPYALGSTIAYSFLLTNTGNVALSNVSVTDPLPGLSAISCPATTLAVGANMTCTATYVVTQADVNNGTVHNSATAQGVPPGPPGGPTPPPVTTPPSEVDVPLEQNPGLILTKSVTSTGPHALGSTIAYSFLLTNTGGVDLSNVSVTDPLPGLSAISCPATTLAVGADMTCTATYVVTATDVGAGNVHNSAIGTGIPPTPPGGPTPPPVTTPPSEVDVLVSAPDLGVAKSGPANATVGVAYDYVITVTNTGTAATTVDAMVADTVPAGLTINSATGCTIAGQLVSCTVPAGLSNVAPNSALSFTVNVTPQVSTVGTTVTNTASVTGGGDPDCTAVGDCPSPPVNTLIGAPNLGVTKNGPTNATVGVAYDYVITVTNTGSAATTALATVTDAVPAGLTINTAAGCTVAGQTVTCPVPAGLAVGASANFTVNVTPQASTAGTTVTNIASVTGGGDPDCAAVGDCPSPPVNTQISRPVVTFNKSSNPASGTDVEVGDVITYTLSVIVADAPTLSDVVLTDTVGAGMGTIVVTNLGSFAGGFSGNTGTFTLASGAAPGTYAVMYTATVQADAGTTVGNSVTATGGNPPPGPGVPPTDPTCGLTCTTTHNVVKPAVTVTKSASPAAGADVAAGDTITYTLTATVANASTLSDVVLTDTLGAGLTFGAVTNAGAFNCTGSLVCTLPTGTAPGTYTVTYTATVAASAATTVSNSVVPTGGSLPPGPGQPPVDPTCTTCSVEHNVVAPVITVAKSSTPASGAEVRAGDTITYTVTATVANSATREVLTLADTLGAGLTFGAVINAGAFACTGALTCTLPAGTPAGSYAMVYTATVDAAAAGALRNVVVPSVPSVPPGGAGGPTCSPTCQTEHQLAAPRVVVAKSATPGEDVQVSVGDVITYTLTATVSNSATRVAVRLVDTPGPGLAVGALPAGCATEGANVVCTLPAGTVPGAYTFDYPATVTADAAVAVENVVIGENVGGGGGGDQPPPECGGSCDTRHILLDESALRIVKAVAVRNVKIGDLVRYTVTVENVGAVNVTDATVVDTPPAGFTYVEGSMSVADRDGAFTLVGKYPLRIGGLDIDAGGHATIVYLLRVGAGVKPGMHINQAVAVNEAGTPISNVATAEVALDSDPLLDDSLVFGTVFDDRDADGWQDRADLGDVRVQGGFAPGAYIAGSSTIDRGDGPQPLADASAPLLHGVDIGAIPARQSEADPVEAHRVTIRQRVGSVDFTDDFVLTSAQGVTVRMDAAGNTTVERSGEAAKGLTAAEPTVQRTVSAVDGGYEVAYVISNAGVDERGIPGVRIASVEGLLIETDQYGRYHLADVQGGDWGHGRNFLLKVDPATLPPGTEFTTENPRVRRVTPGIPVRFDFGVKLPVQVLAGGERKVELELGEVIFAPGSAEVREAYLPAIQRMAEKVDEYRGGEVVITADGDSEALAFARAEAVRDALQARVDAASQAGLNVVLRTRVDDPHSMVAGVNAGGMLLGTVLFDTDKSAIRPEFEGLLDAVAQRLERLGGGVVVLVGHTDVRASHAYNAALGLRRATAVQQALAKRLSPEVRARVRVETSSDPAAPVGTERK